MNLFITTTKLLTILGIVIIISIQGCATKPPVPTSSNVETEIYHYVDKGDTIYSIATRYGRDAADIGRWNNLCPPYNLLTHQKLLVSGPPKNFYQGTSGSCVSSSGVEPYSPISARPIIKKPKKISTTAVAKTKSSGTPSMSPKPITLNKGGKTYHQVQRSETLYSVAKRYGQDYRQVATWNNINPPYELAIGHKLLVSPPSSKASCPPAAPVAVNKATGTKSKSSSSSGKYVVQARDTLYSVAKHFGYSMTDIMAWNSLPSNQLEVGKTIIVGPPSAASYLSAPVTAPSVVGRNYHTVAAGDTLYNISQRYGYSVEQLAQWNKLSSYTLSRGQRLRVSPPTATASSTKNEVTALSTKSKVQRCRHKVSSSETLYSISKRYGYEVTQVAGWNNLPPPYTVKPGQILKITGNCQ